MKPRSREIRGHVAPATESITHAVGRYGDANRDNRTPHNGRQHLDSSTLISRNVMVGSRHTSVRLEPAMWDALGEICHREGVSRHELFGFIDERRQASSLTSAVRVFIMKYFRAAATEEGHASIAHGEIYQPQRSRGDDRSHNSQLWGDTQGAEACPTAIVTPLQDTHR